MPPEDKYARQLRTVWIGIALLAVLRLISVALYPLMESTEARYAEMARLMLESGDWITLWYDYGVPFWGKPPASVWATRISMSLFGINEFAARLPHWLFAILIAACTWYLLRPRGSTLAVISTAILSATSLFMVASGAVMTDMLMTLGITMAMTGFWLAMSSAAPRPGVAILLFTGLAIGLLAKGPVAAVLTGLPLGLWTLWNRQLVLVWRRIPWVFGLLFTLLLVVPWYWLAEQRTPGFLDYFLVGEHWKRFTVSDWSGDLYGNAHDYPRGTIWLYALIALVPWSVLIPAALLLPQKQPAVQPIASHHDGSTGWHRFIMLWALTPMLFFSFAGNILITYVLPAIPAAAIIAAETLLRRLTPSRAFNTVFTGMAVTALMVLASLTYMVSQEDQLKSTRRLIHYYQHQEQPLPLYFYGHSRQYAANFYLQGPVAYLKNEAEIIAAAKQGPLQLAIRRRLYERLSLSAKADLKVQANLGEWLLTRTDGEHTERPASTAEH